MFRRTQREPRLSSRGPLGRFGKDFHSWPGLLQHDGDSARPRRARRRRQKGKNSGKLNTKVPERYHVPGGVRQAGFGRDTLRVRRRRAELGYRRRYAVLHQRRLVSVERG